MGKKIKILYQFATAKLKTPNGDKEVLKRKKFLEKKYHVIVDKPATLNFKQAKDLVKLARKKKDYFPRQLYFIIIIKLMML